MNAPSIFGSFYTKRFRFVQHCFIANLQSLGHQKLRLNFVSRTLRNSKKLPELADPSLFRALRNIACHGNAGSAQL